MTGTAQRLHPGCVVVLLPARLPGPVLPLPAAALPLLRAAAAVYADTSVPATLLAALIAAAGAQPAPAAAELARLASTQPVVLLTADPDAVTALPGARVIATPSSPNAERPAAGLPEVGLPGAALLAAVAVMDRLRGPGGCPWDAEQTHESLRQYLLEETYELLEAIEHGDRSALREELGDVLLQVLFHARIATEHPVAPFDIDDVAAGLVAKLVRRHPHVFAGETAIDAASTERRWEQLKAEEKPHKSIVDGVAFGQPALALAAKLARRAARAGVSDDALPAGQTMAEQLFRLAAKLALSGQDPELAVRAVAKQYAANLPPPT